MLTDLDYKNLSSEVYELDRINKKIKETTEDGKFKIIDVVDSGNGMKAMAVAPVDSNRKIEIF